MKKKITATAKSPYKTEWDFTLFYKSDTDPQIEKDIVLAEKTAQSFEKKWKKDTSYITNTKALETALRAYEKLIGMKEFSRPALYFFLQQDINANDKFATAELSRIQSRLTDAYNKILFFELNLGKITKETQTKILKDQKLKSYHYFLSLIWKSAKHNLSESEEQILSLMNEPASNMWQTGFDRVLANQKVEYKGKMIPIAEALSNISQITDTKERITLWQNINKVFIEVSPFAESEINAVYTKKKIEDKLRGYKNPYDSTLLRYQNDEKTIMNLVQTVTDNFHISHRFYKLKAKLLGLKKLDYGARSVGLGKIKQTFDFEKGCQILSRAFDKVDSKYSRMFEEFLKNGQIDVYPKVGKTGGAYCCGEVDSPTLVLHNYVDSYNSVNTLAHEMGHAFHTELSKFQKPLYQNYTMSVAETASTLFENFAFDEVFETLSEDEKIIALHDKINASVATIFRQVACFNFEKELHEVIRAKGFVPKDEIAQLMNKHMKAYLGPSFDLTDEDGYFFVNWGHIRRFFYVYSYAYGELISTALYTKYQEDKNFLTQIEEFLCAGGSKAPYDIFKDIGIDTRKSDFFLKGLQKIEADIDVLEKLVKNRK